MTNKYNLRSSKQKSGVTKEEREFAAIDESEKEMVDHTYEIVESEAHSGSRISSDVAGERGPTLAEGEATETSTVDVEKQTEVSIGEGKETAEPEHDENDKDVFRFMDLPPRASNQGVQFGPDPR
jgi:hypothetical protein